MIVVKVKVSLIGTCVTECGGKAMLWSCGCVYCQWTRSNSVFASFYKSTRGNTTKLTVVINFALVRVSGAVCSSQQLLTGGRDYGALNGVTQRECKAQPQAATKQLDRTLLKASVYFWYLSTDPQYWLKSTLPNWSILDALDHEAAALPYPGG